jgi:hypothetical protein
LFWCKDAPKFDPDNPQNEAFIDYVDQYVTVSIPHEESELYDIVSSVQMHSKSHSHSCRKGNRICRFNFPRPPSAKTFIIKPSIPPGDVPPSIQRQKASALLEQFREAVNNADQTGVASLEALFHQFNISQDSYEVALCTLAKRNTVVFKRDIHGCWVNPYNEHLLQAWNGNMDIQPVLDPYSCIMYIVSYISKAERELGDLLKRVQKEAEEGHLEPIQQLRQLGNVYLRSREVSIMEAVYRSCGLKLKQSSRDFVFVPTDPFTSR